MNKFNVGDWVWVPNVGNRQVEKPCPVCFGKRQVTLTIGNGDSVILPCDYCKRGYDGPQGVVNEYEYMADAKHVCIQEVRCSETAEGQSVEYRFNDHCLSRGDGVFATKEEALKQCAEIAERLKVEQETRAEHIKKDQAKSYSWNAGYHMREVAKMERDIAYHKRMAVICKARAKATP